ncbi:secreted protein [Melampsora americana]|nr:secreted protein [Melampsora americana]
MASKNPNLIIITCFLILTFLFDVLAIPYPNQSQLGTNSAISRSSTQLQKRSFVAPVTMTPCYVNDYIVRQQKIETFQEKEDKRSTPAILHKNLRIGCLNGKDCGRGKCV